MYSKIKNPENSKMVSIHSKKGRQIIHNYLQELRFFHGGSEMELWQVLDFKIGESFTTSWLEGFTFKIKDIQYVKNQAGLDVPTFIYFNMWNGNKWGTTDFQENLFRDISPGKNFLQTMKKTQTGGKKETDN